MPRMSHSRPMNSSIEMTQPELFGNMARAAIGKSTNEAWFCSTRYGGSSPSQLIFSTWPPTGISMKNVPIHSIGSK